MSVAEPKSDLDRAKSLASNFLKYAWHLSRCAYVQGGDRCTCGYYEARQEARQISSEQEKSNHDS